MFEAAILGVIQGITEFFPVSSTAHLIVLPWFLKWHGQINTLSFDIALHAGTLLSLFVCFRDDIADMLSKNRKLIFFIAVATLPAVAAGLYFHDKVEGRLRDPHIIAAMLVVFGVVMLLSERAKQKKDMKGIGFFNALFIGVAQAIAIVPGVSRSGVTISAGLMMGVKRGEAARFSFLLSIPAIAGAAAYDAKKLLSAPESYDITLFLAGLLAAAITGVIAIKFLLKFLKSHTLNLFVYYRFALAGFIVGWLWLNR